MSMKPDQKRAGGQKPLNAADLSSRRGFLKQAVRKCAAPAIIVYSVHKMTPPAFGRTPI